MSYDGGMNYAKDIDKLTDSTHTPWEVLPHKHKNMYAEYRKSKIKDYLAKKVSYLLPNRVMLWAIVRAFSYTTVHSHPNKTPDEIGYSLLYKSWESKLEMKVKDNGRIN